MRHTASFPIDDLAFWKKQLLHWADGFEFGVYMDSNEHTATEWECLAAAGAMAVLELNAGTAFEQLSIFQDQQKDWLFGFFSYDLKNEVEQLTSQNPDGIGLPDLGFFSPATVISIKSVQFSESLQASYRLEIQTVEPAPEEIFEEIQSAIYAPIKRENSSIVLLPRISKPDYLTTIEAIRRHISGGDVYEMNFCQEFFAENAILDPLLVFGRLNKIGKAPFSSFLRWRDRYLLSASPERFLKKKGQKLISQPIKGTRRRGKSHEEDEQIKQELAANEKDRAENVMIVDLVRNDFSRNCQPGSVQVDELCGIHTFATVHQMISTVSGLLPEILPALDEVKTGKNNETGAAPNISAGLKALRDCFPMGSMTGAPKVMAMELIERFEHTRRGLYSGALGYFAPNGDFDFNVVIRSILYNSDSGYVSAQVGGAIVYDSIPEQEYEECMVKVEAMMRALTDQ